MAKKSTRKEITYCIDGTGLVKDVWLEENASEKSRETGWVDFLNWLVKVQAAPTHTVKSFRVVFEGQGDIEGTLKQVKAKKLKPKDFQVEFAGAKNTGKLLIAHMKGLVKKEKNVVLVSMESSIHRAARDQGVRCITPQDFLMVFQAVL